MPTPKKPPMKKTSTGVGSMTPPKTTKVKDPIGTKYKDDANRPRAKANPKKK